MPSPAEKKIVRFPSDVDPGGGPACEACGGPRQTASFCRACASQLLDVALSSWPGGSTVQDGVFADDPEPTSGKVQLRYEHYEVCLSPEGDPWELGRGAMGITYKATDTYLNRPVALKIINARRLGGARVRDRFLLEARTAAGLRHPNIASIFHLGPGQEDCFYAMEYIEGETLEARVDREGPLPWRLALGIMVQSARGLRAAHAHRFIHRDIKPSNVMLVDGQEQAEERVWVKLIDFGLAKAAADEVAGEAISDPYFAGTPQYASPEQLRSGAVDARSDLYSLGMCLGYMLIGAPFHTVLASIPAGRPIPVSLAQLSGSIPEPVVTLLEKMVSQDPDQRPQSADALLEQVAGSLAEIEAAENLQMPRGNPASPSNQNIRPGRRAKLYGYVAGVGIAALAIVFLAVFISHHGGANGSRTSQEASGSVEARVLHAQATESYRKYTEADNLRAVELYQKAIAASPAYSDAYAKLATAYFDGVCRYGRPTSELDLAITAAQHAIALDPKAAGGFQIIGTVRGFQGRPWDALMELHRALELEPKNASAMCDFSLLWICVGEPQLGLPWARAAAKLQPSRTVGWHAAAEASVELCDDVLAEEYYRRCTEIEPTWMSPYCGLMHIHLLQGDFGRAHQDYAKAESIQSGLLLPLTLNAQLTLFSGDYAGAESCYRRLLALNRGGLVRYYSGISYLSALGFLRLRAGDTVEGETLLSEAEKLHASGSEGSENIYDLAAIRAIQNRKEDALMLLDQAIQSGWNDYRASRLDPRFAALRGELRFERMLNDLSVRVSEMRREGTALCSKPLDLADYPIVPRRTTRGE